ncbi:MAG: DnaJ domain-containing protein [Gammaproteobacteria bacterium]|nr:DnaJ domain-containing protein [Gammaproteobacteria bacterium]
MEYKDYYKILGVSRGASAEEVKRAYRRLARQYHPDKNKAAGAEDRFKEINEAHEVLSDPEKRRAYDALGANWKAGQGFTPPPGWDFGSAVGGAGRARHSRAEDFGGFSDFFSTLFGSGLDGGFSQGYEDFGERGAAGRTAPNQRAQLTITLEDSYHGAARQIALAGGRRLNVRIPRGVTAGQTIRLGGQATGGGDLLLEIAFAPHPQFVLDGRDVQSTLPITPWQAALGAKLPVATLGGNVELQVPAGAQSGTRLRLRGRGLPGKPPGDQIVQLAIHTPPAASEADREFYREMSRRFAFDPRGS